MKWGKMMVQVIDKKKYRAIALIIIISVICSFLNLYSVYAANTTNNAGKLLNLVNSKKMIYYDTYILEGKNYKVYITNDTNFNYKDKQYNLYTAVYTDENNNIVVDTNKISKLSEVLLVNKIMNKRVIQGKIGIINDYLNSISKYKFLSNYCEFVGTAGAEIFNPDAIVGYVEQKSVDYAISCACFEASIIALAKTNSIIAMNKYQEALQLFDNVKNRNYSDVHSEISNIDLAESYNECSLGILYDYKLNDISKSNALTSFKLTYGSFITGLLGSEEFLKMPISDVDKNNIKLMKKLATELKKKSDKDTVKSRVKEILTIFANLEVIKKYDFDLKSVPSSKKMRDGIIESSSNLSQALIK